MKTQINKAQIDLIKEWVPNANILENFKGRKPKKVSAGGTDHELYDMTSAEKKLVEEGAAPINFRAEVYKAFQKALRKKQIAADMELFKTLDVGMGVHEKISGHMKAYTVVKVSKAREKFWIRRDEALLIDGTDEYLLDFDPDGEEREIRPTIKGYMQEAGNTESKFFMGSQEYHPAEGEIVDVEEEDDLDDNEA